MLKIITRNARETKQVGKELAQTISSGGLVCLEGNLGSGKTTFTQGLLKALGIKGSYTSPTFVILKHYKLKNDNIYHIDAYRIGPKDLLSLGWKELISNRKNIVIVEWADRIKKIVPKRARWIRFKWLDQNQRQIDLP